MKKLSYLLLILILCSFQMSYAQEITGIATYKSFLKFDLKVDSTKVNSEMHQRLEQMIKAHSRKEYELHFTINESVFKEKEKLETPGNNMFPGAQVSTSGGYGSFYINKKENRFVNQVDLYGKLFLVSDTLQKQEWKLEKETKNIGDYICFKATRSRIGKDLNGKEIEKEVTAWYTPQIPVDFGPMTHGGLPGLILEIQDGDFTYLCNQIVLNPKSGVSISPAKKGEVVSQQEYDEIRLKKSKEMQEGTSFPGENIINIRIGG